MSELLFEVYSEEIPALLQEEAAQKMATLLVDNLISYGISVEVKAFSTPRRIGFAIFNLPTSISIPSEEIRGPRLNANPMAIEGFLRKYSCSKEQLIIKNDCYFFQIPAKVIDIKQHLAGQLNELLTTYTWPKSMRWGEHLKTWIRPIKSMIALLDGHIIPVTYGEITAQDTTFGHRFMSYTPIKVASFADYQQKLKEHNVDIYHASRRELIREEAIKKATELGAKLIEDELLLNEIAGLVEKPFIHVGQIDELFMSLPREVLVITLKHHQRYLMLEDGQGELSRYFIIIANINAKDGGQKIVEGNTKVLKARLFDAKYFYDRDVKIPLEDRLEMLKKVVYHERVGSVYQKSQQSKELAGRLAADLNLDVTLAERAALLAKADLVSEMVKEFPELQGVMGGYYATAQNEHEEVAIAIREHYKPQGPNDSLPSRKIAAVTALADKFDNLNSLFSIGIKPTGSKDPYAQRRAALGILRIIKEFAFQLDLANYLIPEAQAFVEGKDS